MLRISRAETQSNESLLRLDGDISGPWVEELREAIASAARSSERVDLDLSGVQFADEDGVLLLRDVVARGSRLLAPSPFLRILLTGHPTP